MHGASAEMPREHLSSFSGWSIVHTAHQQTQRLMSAATLFATAVCYTYKQPVVIVDFLRAISSAASFSSVASLQQALNIVYGQSFRYFEAK
jgi:hypothetical protein